MAGAGIQWRFGGAAPPPRSRPTRPCFDRNARNQYVSPGHFKDSIHQMTARRDKLSPMRFVDSNWESAMVSQWLHGVVGADKEFRDRVKAVFGHELRPWQEHATAQLRKGRDIMVKAGTGAGKSLVYQSMTQSRPNAIVLVICPLVSLMEEQVVPIRNIVLTSGGKDEQVRYGVCRNARKGPESTCRTDKRWSRWRNWD